MAIANPLQGWVNSDGLRVKFAPDEAVRGVGGTYKIAIGSQKITELDVDFSVVALGTTATNVVVLDWDVVLPDTAVIEKVEFITGTAWATDTSISFGLVRRSDFTTIIANNAIFNALVLAQRTAGKTTTANAGDTYAGTLVGTQAGIGFDAVICANWAGAAPTAGTGKLRVYWR